MFERISCTVHLLESQEHVTSSISLIAPIVNILSFDPMEIHSVNNWILVPLLHPFLYYDVQAVLYSCTSGVEIISVR